MNALRRIFLPTTEEIADDIEMIRKLREEQLNEPQPKLISKEGSVLLTSSPFKPFARDCEKCVHYWSRNVGFVEGGYCSKHNNIDCGWGFTCEDWEGRICFRIEKENILKIDIFNTNKKYKTIYADPPWNESGGGRIKRGADRHYSLMKTKDIMALPIQNIADENCHLYLWTTNNFLPDALKVMEAWGFAYKTMITWSKDRIGLGQYFRGLTEHCLFGVKGVLPYKLSDEGKRCQGKTGFYAPKGEHSEKPKEMREMIELVSYEPYIELFARQAVDGWDRWGEEA